MKLDPGNKFARYIGDGVYASFDGFQIWLAVNHHTNNVVALEPPVLAEFDQYRRDLNETLKEMASPRIVGLGSESALRCRFRVRGPTDGVLFLIDANDGAKSMTNDAEAVVAWAVAEYGSNIRVVYKDTEGSWDEMEHEDGVFTNFKCYAGYTPAGA